MWTRVSRVVLRFQRGGWFFFDAEPNSQFIWTKLLRLKSNLSEGHKEVVNIRISVSFTGRNEQRYIPDVAYTPNIYHGGI